LLPVFFFFLFFLLLFTAVDGKKKKKRGAHSNTCKEGGERERCLTDSKNDVLNDVRGSLLFFIFSLPLVFEGAIKDTLGILHISINNFFPFFLPWSVNS
jgi:hypothetical protein